MQEQLFTLALGLTPPWAVDSVSFRPDEGAIHFEVACQARRLACPACGAPAQPVHDRVARTWQHLHFFQYKAFIHCRVPRVVCAQCGKTPQTPVPWAAAGSGFSMLLEAFVVTLCAALPVAHVARLIGVSDDRIWRVLHRHVAAARAREEFADVRRVGVDETASRRGQRYVTLFHDLDRRRLLFATPGRDRATFARFADDLAQHGATASQLTDWCMDLSGAYQAGARHTAPQAAIGFDPYHVVALAHTALDQVRRAEVKTRPELKHSRWGTLKAPRHWNRQQLDVMHWLQRATLKTARAWRLKEALRRVYETAGDGATAEPLLRHWVSWARRCRLTPFKRLGATVRDHQAGILRHFDTGLSNGAVEAFNAHIQAAKARAKGYRTDANLIAIAYLLCARLRHLPRNPWLHPTAQP
jgi:transposase